MSTGREPGAAVEAALGAAGDDELNAFISVDEDALERARLIDEDDRPGPLAGRPVALKDLIDHSGRTTTAGSSFYRHLATRSATVVERLEAAGAVVMGRNNLHEFAFGFSSENAWFGPVRNPWDPTLSAGGSSGGSAAAVAAGIVPVAIGTDTGGSVRVPAALCGCVGLKVGHGRVPLTGVFPLCGTLDTVGPIARTVSDAAAVFSVIAGHHPADPWSSPEPVEATGGAATLEGLRIAVPHPWVDRPLDPWLKSGFESFVAGLVDAGAVVRVVRLPSLDPEALRPATYAEAGAVHRRWFEEDPERYGPSVRSRVAAVIDFDADAVSEAHRWRAGLRHAFAGAFASTDLLLTPTTAAWRKVIGVDEVEVAGTREGYRGAFSWFTTLPSQAGLPALALPVAGTAAPGRPPASVQLIAPRHREPALLAIGLALEEAGLVGFSPPVRAESGQLPTDRP